MSGTSARNYNLRYAAYRYAEMNGIKDYVMDELFQSVYPAGQREKSVHFTQVMAVVNADQINQRPQKTGITFSTRSDGPRA